MCNVYAGRVLPTQKFYVPFGHTQHEFMCLFQILCAQFLLHFYIGEPVFQDIPDLFYSHTILLYYPTLNVHVLVYSCVCMCIQTDRQLKALHFRGAVMVEGMCQLVIWCANVARAQSRQYPVPGTIKVTCIFHAINISTRSEEQVVELWWREQSLYCTYSQWSSLECSHKMVLNWGWSIKRGILNMVSQTGSL